MEQQNTNTVPHSGKASHLRTPGGEELQCTASHQTCRLATAASRHHSKTFRATALGTPGERKDNWAACWEKTQDLKGSEERGISKWCMGFDLFCVGQKYFREKPERPERKKTKSNT